MAKVKIRPFANIREIVGEHELFLDALTIREALTALIAQTPALRDILCDDSTLRAYITVLINGTNINDIAGVQSPLVDGDEVAIFPPVSGG